MSYITNFPVKIIGILNLNNESFFDGGKYVEIVKAVQYAEKMIFDGADIIEIGGFSTKPGSVVPSIEEELRRIIPTLEILDSLQIPLSIETTRYEIVQHVLKYKNVVMINDTSGLKDVRIATYLEKKIDVSYVLMHNPVDYIEINNKDPKYNRDIIEEVYNFFEKKIKYLKKNGCTNIILDPGFYFHKSTSDNSRLLQNLSHFQSLGYPIFVGLSRKSAILSLEKSKTHLALIETCIMNFEALKHGASFIRVHDIFEARYTKLLYKKYSSLS